MTTVLHPTGSTATSPVGAQYNSVDRVMFLDILGARVGITVEQAQKLAEDICRESDCRTTAHPYDFVQAAGHIHHARQAVS